MFADRVASGPARGFDQPMMRALGCVVRQLWGSVDDHSRPPFRNSLCSPRRLCGVRSPQRTGALFRYRAPNSTNRRRPRQSRTSASDSLTSSRIATWPGGAPSIKRRYTACRSGQGSARSRSVKIASVRSFTGRRVAVLAAGLPAEQSGAAMQWRSTGVGQSSPWAPHVCPPWQSDRRPRSWTCDAGTPPLASENFRDRDRCGGALAAGHALPGSWRTAEGTPEIVSGRPLREPPTPADNGVGFHSSQGHPSAARGKRVALTKANLGRPGDAKPRVHRPPGRGSPGRRRGCTRIGAAMSVLTSASPLPRATPGSPGCRGAKGRSA